MIEKDEPVYDYIKETSGEFKERLLMEYTMLVEKMKDLQIYLDKYNNGNDMTQDQNSYLQLMGKQMEAMTQYRICLYNRIMMIMDRKI